MVEPDGLLDAIRASWSPDTTDDWHPSDPAAHQCGVTALVVQDYLGGIIVRNKFAGRTTWFNRLPNGAEIFHRPELAGCPREFAADQIQPRELVMAHSSMPRRYAALSAGVRQRLA